MAISSGMLFSFSTLIIPRLLGSNMNTLGIHWAVFGGVACFTSVISGFIFDRLGTRFFMLSGLAAAAAIGSFFYFHFTPNAANILIFAGSLGLAQAAWDVPILASISITQESHPEAAFSRAFTYFFGVYMGHFFQSKLETV